MADSYNPLDALRGYFFADQSKMPLAEKALESRRRIAQILAARKSAAPKNIGEGIYSAAGDIADALYNRNLDRQEQAFMQNYQQNRPMPADLPKLGTSSSTPVVGQTAYAPVTDPLMRQTAGADINSDAMAMQSPFGGTSDEPGPTLAETLAPNPLREAVREYQASQPSLSPDRPSQWGSGPLAEVPTDMSSVAPGTFGLSPQTERPVAAEPTNALEAINAALSKVKRPMAYAAADNPPIVADIPAAPASIRMAEAGTVRRVPIPEAAKDLPEAVPPSLTPMSPQELKALDMYNRFLPIDSNLATAWGNVAKQWEQYRTQLDVQKNKIYEAQIARKTTDVAASQSAKREFEKQVYEGKIPQPTEPSADIESRYARDPNINTPNSLQRNRLPEPPLVPPGTPAQKHAEAYATDIKNTRDLLERNQPKVESALNIIEQIRKHPGQRWGLGLTSEQAYKLGGSEAVGFKALVDQLGGKLFLEAYNDLRGTGAIATKEGQEAKGALGRIATAQSPADFKAALNDLENDFRSGLERAQRKAHEPVTAWRKPGDNSSYAPDRYTRDPEHPDYQYMEGDPGNRSSWRKIR